jgi:hypothetical protein
LPPLVKSDYVRPPMRNQHFIPVIYLRKPGKAKEPESQPTMLSPQGHHCLIAS